MEYSLFLSSFFYPLSIEALTCKILFMVEACFGALLPKVNIVKD
jgi:hypothetical protein